MESLSVVTREDMYYAYLAGKTDIVLPVPITRREKYLAYLAGMVDVELPIPITREEFFYSYIALKTNGTYPKPLTRKEKYLAYWLGDKSINIPEPITRREQFLYAVCIASDKPSEPVEFQAIEDGKLIILGAHSINERPKGIYLDCEPENQENDWIDPVQDGNVLTIEQVYSATPDGNVLEVE